jgi:zinc protease
MKIDRTKRPTASGEMNFEVPQISEDTLSNGLIYFYSRKTELPIIRVNLLVNCGSIFDSENKKGLSNLLVLCIDEGAGKYNSFQLADEFEKLGARFAVSSDLDIAILSMQVLKENFNDALKLFRSVIVDPHLYEEDFNRERRKTLVRINQYKIKPDYIADVSFEHFLFGKECPYSYPVIGYEKSVENIFHQDVKDFYQQNFSPLNSTLVVVGDYDPGSLKETLSEEFGNWENNSLINNSEFKLNDQKRKIIIVNKPDSVQTEIRTGHLSGKRNESDYFRNQIINLVLGGEFSSRLNINLREKHGYTYGIYSSFFYLKKAGYLKISTSVATESTANALREIFSEIKKIKEGINSEELNFAKSTIINRFPSGFETYGQISSNIIMKVFHNLRDDFFETYLQKTSSVTLDEVNNFAAKSINSEELTTILVGDSKKIIPQINDEEFGETEVVEFDDLFL